MTVYVHLFSDYPATSSRTLLLSDMKKQKQHILFHAGPEHILRWIVGWLLFGYRIGAGVECIDALLRAGADRSLRDMDGRTALDAAIEAGREECARALNLEIGDATVSNGKVFI